MWPASRKGFTSPELQPADLRSGVAMGGDPSGGLQLLPMCCCRTLHGCYGQGQRSRAALTRRGEKTKSFSSASRVAAKIFADRDVNQQNIWNLGWKFVLLKHSLITLFTDCCLATFVSDTKFCSFFLCIVNENFDCCTYSSCTAYLLSK